jgi:cytochrome P450
MEALSHRHLRDFFPTLRAVTQRLLRRWDAAATSGDTLDVTEELKRFTVDVTTALTFGHDVNTLEASGDDIIQRHLELVFPAFNRRLFAPLPLWRLVRLPADRRLDRAMVALRTWLGELVAKARAAAAADPARAARPSNFLEAMLVARDDAGQPFGDDIIFGNLMTMLLAGEDTTAYSLAWAIHHVCESPAALAGLHDETDALLADSAVPGDLETADQLAYAGAVANEAMRLRPVAPLIFGESIVDTVIGDVQVPAKTPVMVLTRPPVRDPAHFAEPDRFWPERWLESSAARPHEPATHIPFGTGPRICPGRNLALLEMKMVLGAIYRSFEVERVGAAGEVRELFAFTMSPAGLRVRLRRRITGR